MLRVGLTGGIGSGKTLVARIFSALGVPVYDSDGRAKWLSGNDAAVREAVAREFGRDIYSEGGLDRKRLASIVFSDPEKLKTLNGIVHPALGRDFERWAHEMDACGHSYVVLESAILFESGFDRYTDGTVTVSAPLQTRIERVAARDGASAESVRARVSNQMPDARREELADHIVVNDGRTPLLNIILELDENFKNKCR